MLVMVWISRNTAISLAFILALPSLGTAMARIIRMIAITIRSSMSEKPREPRRRRQDCRMTLIMTEIRPPAWKATLEAGYWLLVAGFEAPSDTITAGAFWALARLFKAAKERPCQ